ncbi:MAG: enoyl-CoA hydratase/isomerase family protein [Xanthobacteraceae bacterium]
MAGNETVLDTGTNELLCSLADGVATLTLNRPEAKNALSAPMQQGFQKMMKECSENPAVRVILITASGNAFCAGGDVRTWASAVHRSRRNSVSRK